MKAVIDLVFAPLFFNVLCMGLYLLAAIRWAYAGSWADFWYWISAIMITAVVTFGYRHC